MRNLTVEFSAPTVATFNATAGTHDITARISWVEPEEPSGVISMYEYSIALDADPSDIVASGMLSTMMTSIEPPVIVLPYMRYNFTVTARTGGGSGTLVSEVEFSPEAGKYVLFTLSKNCLKVTTTPSCSLIFLVFIPWHNFAPLLLEG